MADVAEHIKRVEANLDYATSGSTAKAEVLLQSIDFLLIARPTMIRKGAASQLEFDAQSLREMKATVTKWLQQQYRSNSPEKTYFDLRRSRL